METTITLTPAQMKHAAGVAKRLHDNLRRRGIKNAHGLRKKDATPEMEAGGAQAELALSLLLGVPWTTENSLDPFGPDVGTRTQVRSSLVPRPHHNLLIRPRDIEKYGDVPFVLVIQTGNKFTVHGWMMALEATRQGRLWDGGDRGRPEVWFVPEEKLLPLTTLKNP